MKKFISYSLQVTGFLITAIIILFVAPATAAAAPTATISAWQWNGRPGQNLTFTANATAPGASRTGVRIYRTPASSQSWTLMNNSICNGSTCSLNASWTAATGDWFIVVNAYANPTTADYFTGNPTTECTGSPWGYNSTQWSGCGSNSYTWIRISNPPTPSVNANLSCTPGNTSNMYTVSWASSSPAITYIDVSTSGNFSTYFNKAVTGTSTPMSSFTGYWNGSSWGGGSLTLWPNTTYYTRLWDGFNHSNVTTFTTPGTCTPPAGQITSPANNSTVIVNQSVTISATAQIQRGSLTRGELWASPTGGENWLSPAIAAPTWNGSSPQSFSGTWTPTSIGSYYIVINAFDDINGSKCTGNPFRLPSGWSTCGSGGSIKLNVIPNCNTGISCSGSCSAPANTCSANNGTRSGCIYTTYTGGGTCNQVNAPNQACTINNCPSGYTCSSGACTPPPPPTANLNAPANNSSNIINQSMTVSATAAGTNLKKINIYRAPKGTSNWTRIAENDTCGGQSICGVSSSWTPTAAEVGQWDISVNAFDNYGQQCSGMHTTPGGYWTANCDRNGSTSNVVVNVVPPPPPAPSVSATPICTPTDTSGMYTISWSNISPQITYVDISDNNFAAVDWWNKYVAGSTSTAASTGFGGPKGALILQPNKTYYVRLWNGAHSSTATFTTPVSCACTGNNIIDNPADPLPATYVIGTSYNINGWGTFCSGPNGTNRNRVDIHLCDRGTWNCRQLGSATSYPRPDVVNTATSPTWTCGNLNPNPDGWTFSFTPDSSSLGNKDLFVASINDPKTTCYIGTSKQVNITPPPPPTANLNAPANNSSNIINQSMTVSATAAGTNLKKINIYRAPKGTSNWTRIAENDTCGGQSICGVSSSWTPTAAEVGQWDISVNAFDNYGQQCSGMHTTPGGYWTANCDRNGSTSNVMINVVFPSPTAQITSPVNNSSFITGQNINVTAAAQIISPGSLTRGEIVVTNATDPNNPTLPVNCPGRTNGYWCYIKEATLTGRSALFEGDWIPRAAGVYRIAVNAFDDTNNTKCTGNPFTVAAGWSSCGSYRWTQVNVAPPPPPPTTTINSPANQTPITIGQSMTFSATANGSNLTWMDIYRAPVNTQDWTKIAGGSCSGSTCTLSGPWTPAAGDVKQWKIAVNAFDSYDQRCSGTEITQPSYWTDYCGRNGSTSNITVNVILPPPQATISGSKTATVTDTPSYTATLSETAQSGQIWITKGNGLDRFSCNTQMKLANNTQRYWCLVGQGIRESGTELSITGGYQFNEPGEYTVVVNAFNQTNPEGTSQADRCTGTPDALAGGNVTWDTWSRCDPDPNPPLNSKAYITVTANPPLTTTNCGGGINPRAEGLVTTPSLTGQFGTSTEGKCVVDTKTTFTPFKIPSYDELKSLYYTQSKVKIAPKADSTLVPESEDGKVFSYTAPNVSVDSLYRYNKTAVIFIEGNLNIDKNIITDPATPAKGVVFVVQRNVNIDQSVNRIDAIIISAGNIYTATTAGAVCATNSVNVGASANALTVNGSLVSLNPGQIVFCRTLNRNDCASCAAEKINNQPKYLVILSNLFASTLQKWSDITAGGSVVPTNCKAFNGNASACYNKGCSYNYLAGECQ